MQSKQYSTIIGVDLGDRQHHICVTDKLGNILAERVIANTGEALLKLASAHRGALMVIEVGTHSPWISRLLEANGCACLVANARKLRAIYQNDRKCDQLDARMLAKLARVDPELLCPIAHGSEQQQTHRLRLTLRDSLVRQRTSMINTIRFALKSLGVRLPGCATASFARQCRQQLDGSPWVDAVEASLAALETLNAQIKSLDQQIAQIACAHYPQTQILQQITGVGPLTALSFVLAVGEPERFDNARDVGAYFGLVPRRDQSGLSDKPLPISKAGDGHVRRLLVQCAQYILGRFGPDCNLRRYGLALAAKGGKSSKKKAVIAVARKLAVLMLVLWKTGQPYEPLRHAGDEQPTINQAA